MKYLDIKILITLRINLLFWLNNKFVPNVIKHYDNVTMQKGTQMAFGYAPRNWLFVNQNDF